MGTIVELAAEVSQLKSVDQGVITLLDGLADKLEQSISSPAAIQAIIDDIRTERQNLTAAVVRDTPADPNPSTGQDTQSGEQSISDQAAGGENVTGAAGTDAGVKTL